MSIEIPIASEYHNNTLSSTLLINKQDGVVHSRNLKLYLEKEVTVLKHIIRKINFILKDYLMEYIDFIIQMMA